MSMRRLFLMLSLTLILSFLLSVGFVSAQETGSEDANKALVESYYQEFYVEKNKENVEAYFTENFVEWNPEGQLSFTDYDGLREYLKSALPDLQADLEMIVAEGDYVVAKYTIWAPESGIDRLPLVDIYRIENGRIAEVWELYDRVPIFAAFSVLESDEATADTDASQEANTAEANKALIWSFYEEFYVEKNKDNVEKYFNETFVEWSPGGVLTFTDYDALHEYLNSNWSDLQVDMQTVFAEGDYVATRSVIWAPETGLDETMAMQIFRLENGRISELWEVYDQLPIYALFGMVEFVEETEAENPESATEQVSSAEANKAMMRSYYQEFYAEKNKENVDKWFTEDFVEITPEGTYVTTSYDELRTYMKGVPPDIETRLDMQIAEDDIVVNVYTIWGDVTGLDELPIVNIYRIEDGRIAEAREFYDRVPVYETFGMIRYVGEGEESAEQACSTWAACMQLMWNDLLGTMNGN